MGAECCANTAFFTGHLIDGRLHNTIEIEFIPPVATLPNYGYPLLLLSLLLAGTGALMLRG